LKKKEEKKIDLEIESAKSTFVNVELLSKLLSFRDSGFKKKQILSVRKKF
jgi:hypothetical protein